MIIEMDGLSIEISRKKIKNMYLRIHSPTGDVKVTASHKITYDAIHAFLLLKRSWIHKARARVIERERPNALRMEHGAHHFFLGKPYVLMIHTNAAHMKIEITGQYLNCFIKPGTQPERSLLFIQSWYKQQMLQLLPSLIQKWEPIIGVTVQAWGVRLMNTRWGSCHVVSKRISLNLKLIQKPLDCLEYVLVHEMVHLHEANHSHRFYALMDKFLPSWRKSKSLLDQASA
ncbi:MAG: SprT family zinc-dependent metalloprotease [Legionellaceae bacterium]|nr:SprT family zinc-dependent metalloprotease [Legionellaceae bacterium]